MEMQTLATFSCYILFLISLLSLANPNNFSQCKFNVFLVYRAVHHAPFLVLSLAKQGKWFPTCTQINKTNLQIKGSLTPHA